MTMSQIPVIKRHFSPLRYPGGKGKLCSYIKAIIETNHLHDREYVELYAGGAGVAIELLVQEYVPSIHINDYSRPVYAVWDAILNHTEDFCQKIRDCRLTLRAWDRHRNIFANESEFDSLELGFATFFLNRTNRSGILNGGVIGGRQQLGKWGIDARFNRKNLQDRVRMIADFRDRISLSNSDAFELIQAESDTWRENSFVYLDPPYYTKGRDLYYDFYEDGDHEAIAKSLAKLKEHAWIVSYDNHPRIRDLFSDFQSATYDLNYTARQHKVGTEIMLFSPMLEVPEATGVMRDFTVADRQSVAIQAV